LTGLEAVHHDGVLPVEAEGKGNGALPLVKTGIAGWYIRGGR
jgi:hypothetical protein